MRNSSINPAGKVLQAARQKAALGLRELARRAGLSHVALLKIETGERTATLKTLLRISDALEIPDAERESLVSRYIQSEGVGLFAERVIMEALCEAGLTPTLSNDRSFDVIVDCGDKLKIGLSIKLLTLA